MSTLCKQFQHIDKSFDTYDIMQEKNFYNSILADKKPYFFRYKYNFLNKEINEYDKKTDQNCQLRFAKSLKELLQQYKTNPETLDKAQVEFVKYYYKFLPVIDSKCVMNKICHYIESVDFDIKKKVRNSSDFDYTVLLSNQNFIVNKKIYGKIVDEVEDTLKTWESKLKVNSRNYIKNDTHDLVQKKFDKDIEIGLLKNRLELITSNEEQLTNHLIYLFYVDKPNLSKGTLWNLVGKQIFENVKSKTESYFYPVKNENGTLEFLYEKYSIEEIMVKRNEKVTPDNLINIKTLLESANEEEIDMEEGADDIND